MKKLLFFFGFALTALLALALLPGPAAATHVAPVIVSGNPNCTNLGYDNGFKIDAQVVGDGLVFTLTDGTQNGYPTEVTSGPQDPNNSVTINNSDGVTFDWTATLGIDAVIVKASDANVYYYDPESMGDTGLTTPEGKDISHIEFCYDYEVDVIKDAQTTFTRTFAWTINKSVSPETWDLFTGDSGTSKYTVAVTKDAGTDSDWAVSGTIGIDNNTPFDATITDVTDVVSPDISASVDCGVTFPYVLASGDSLSCIYGTMLPDGSDRTNKATVTTSGDVGGGEATADVTFGAPTAVVYDTINVDDTNGGSWMFSDSGSVMYERTFTCDSDAGTHDNTATIRETGQNDNASVTVNCYALTVTKDADTTFTRTWDWTIDKTADQANLTLSEGQLFTVNYEVTVNATAADSGFAVTGDIWIANPAPIDATLTDVSDIVSPDIAATVSCSSLVVPANNSLHCTYSANLPDGTSRTNTATATLQNYDYDSSGVGTPSGTTDFASDPVDVIFGDPANETDECVDVNDTNVGFLDTVCAGVDTLPMTFNYSLSFGAHPDADVQLVCGDNTHTNIASFITNDNGETGDDDWTVNANVACDAGCTLTQGYWKTHSREGPAPYDNAWQNLGPDEEDTVFFLSGQSYYEVLWTAPKGNAYYILAHQYIAAQLNFLNGASAPADVQDAFDEATSLFNTYTPDQVDGLKGKDKKTWTDLATTLDNYNNGIIGPGHCSE